MIMRYYPWIVVLALFVVLILTLTLLRPSDVQAQGQPKYPIMDKIADKIIQKYQSSTCEQLWIKKSEKAPPSPEEVRAVGILKSDPQNAHCIHQENCSTTNKMFDCGLIP